MEKLNLSKKFISLVKKSVKASELIFVGISDIDFNEIENVIVIRCKVKENANGNVVGHGISLRPYSDNTYQFFHNGCTLKVSLGDIIEDILPYISSQMSFRMKSIYDIVKHVNKLEENSKLYEKLFNEALDSKKYYMNKLYCLEYEIKQEKEREKNLPF